MILVDDAGECWNNLLDHSPWDNVTLADFVMPFFLFIVGVSAVHSVIILLLYVLFDQAHAIFRPKVHTILY